MDPSTTRPLLIATALAALATAVGLLALQIFGGLEYTEGGTTYFRYSMIAAMIVLALLPIFIEVARRTGHRTIGAALFIAFLSFLAYSLPANIGRNGEIKEVKAVQHGDAVQARADMASLTRSLNWFRTEMMRECEGAPEPLPPRQWPKCRNARANVKALEERRDRLERQIAQAPAVGDVGSETMAWATAGMVSEKNIRRSSVVAFALGLDVAIWALVWLATTLLTSLPARAAVTVPAPVMSAAHRVVLEPTETDDDLPSGGQKLKQEALADLLTLSAMGREVPSQDWLAERWGRPKGTVSKWLTDWEGRDLITRSQAGRCKAVSA